MKTQKKLYSLFFLSLSMVPFAYIQESYGTWYDPIGNYCIQKGWNKYPEYSLRWEAEYGISRKTTAWQLVAIRGVSFIGAVLAYKALKKYVYRPLVSHFSSKKQAKPAEISAPLNSHDAAERCRVALLSYDEVRVLYQGTQEQYEDLCFANPLRIDFYAKNAPQKHRLMLERADVRGPGNQLKEKFYTAYSSNSLSVESLIKLKELFGHLADDYSEESQLQTQSRKDQIAADESFARSL